MHFFQGINPLTTNLSEIEGMNSIRPLRMYMHVNQRNRKRRTGSWPCRRPAGRRRALRLAYGPCLPPGLPPLGGRLGPPLSSTCMISRSQPPSAPATAAASDNGLAARITLQHCISTTASSTALAIVAVDDAISDGQLTS